MKSRKFFKWNLNLNNVLIYYSDIVQYEYSLIHDIKTLSKPV